MVFIFSMRQYGERVERLVSSFSESSVEKPTKVAASAGINWMRSERPRYEDSLIREQLELTPCPPSLSYKSCQRL